MSFEATRILLNTYRKDHPFVFYFLVIYLGSILSNIIFFLIFYADHSQPMALNEVGDFLAGAFSPIAFLFLYLGYDQNSKAIKIQSDELKVSNESFKKQCEELKNSVEQQKSIASTTEQELEYLKRQSEIELDIMLTNAQPFFHFNIDNAVKHDFNRAKRILIEPNDLLYKNFEFLLFKVDFSNSRTIARELELKIECDSEIRFLKVYNIIDSDTNKITFTIKNKAENLDYLKYCNISLIFSYFDNLDLLQEQKFTLILTEKDDSHLVAVGIRRDPRNFRKF